MEKTDEIYEKVILQSEENVKKLSEQLNALEQLQNEVSELPNFFDKKLKQISELANDYTKKLGISSGVYLQKSNELFSSKIDELTEIFIEIKKEVGRLKETDFVELFKVLQNEFIKSARADLNQELNKFDAKIEDLHNNIDIFKDRIADLKTEITRLENIDIEKHFDKLQKTLSDIFGAVNSLNTSFTIVIQTLNKIVQSNSDIETKLEKNAKDIKIEIEKSVNDFGKQFQQLKGQLQHQQEIITQTKELIESKYEKLQVQNENLIKGIKTNRFLAIIAIILITALLAIQFFLK